MAANVDTIISKYNKKFKGNLEVVSKSEKELRSNVPFWLDTGNKGLNSVLGDKELGIPSGRIIELYGQPSGGKSTLSYYLIALYQKAGAVAVLADVEGSYMQEWGEMNGVNHDELLMLQLGFNEKQKRYESLEDLFVKFRQLSEIAKEEKDMPMFIVWDSIPATLSTKEIEADSDKSLVAAKALALNRCIYEFSGGIVGTSTTLLCINQSRDKITPTLTYETTPGGSGLKYAASVRVKTRKTQARGNFSNHELQNKKNKISNPYEKLSYKIGKDGEAGLII